VLIDEEPNIPPDIIAKANQGDVLAQLELGKAYFNATWVKGNTHLAFEWISRSAKQGNMEAQFRLGNLYTLGQGTSKCISSSYQWYTKAALQGYKKALLRIHNLYQQDIKMHCRGQLNSEEKEWSSSTFKKKNQIRELNEYRVAQSQTILNGAINYYTEQFKFYKSCNQDDPVTQINLAFLYQHGYGVKKCTRWAFEYYELAAQQGNMNAQYNLGCLYQKHSRMKFNYREAFKWYTKSAQGGHIAAQKCLAYFYLKGLATDINYENVTFWYNKAAKFGDSEAQVTLGKLYRKGDCVKKDLLMSVKWYSLAARQGNIVAQNCLSQLHQRGMLDSVELEEDTSEYVTENSMKSRLCTKLSIDVSKRDNSLNFKQLNELARCALIGDGHAMYEIGLKYLKGDNDFTQDQDTGVKWIKNAAIAKHKTAQFMLADLYKKGDSIEQDYHKATTWYKSLAKQKDPDAQYNVGVMYNEGLGVRNDPLEASKWFIWSADQGNSDAQYSVAMFRLVGRGLRKDRQEALSWLYKSAYQKNTQACYTLGNFYYQGLHTIEKDIKTGLKLLDFSASHGFIQAQLEIALVYKEGRIIDKDIQQCMYYLTMAADSGSAEAQYELAVIYLNGDGADYDYLKAYSLFKLAKNRGSSRAENIFDIHIKKDDRIKDQYKVLDMLIKVSEQGLDDLHYQVGSIHEYGIFDIALESHCIPADYNKAREWYLAASAKGDFRADRRLGIIYEYGIEIEEDFDTAIGYYQKASNNGSGDASYTLARMYFEGNEVNQDFLKAFQYYTAASIAGHPEAREALTVSEMTLGPNTSSSNHLQNTKEDKMVMLEKATEKGYALLQYDIGLVYYNNKDDSKAFKWLSAAADIGITDAYYRLGTLYEEGRGIDQDYNMAVKMYEKAVEKEHQDACYRLGQLYQYGKGFAVDYLKAYSLYKKAADMGHGKSQSILDITMQSNRNTIENSFSLSPQEYQDSLLMCKHVAEHGDTEVQFKVGFAYEHIVLEPNYVEAHKLYLSAAKSSHREAIYHLGLLYKKGLGISLDYARSNQLYEQASQLGSADALYQLGSTYRYGKGVDIDTEKAIEYYTLSAQLGRPEYQCQLGRLYEDSELVQKNLLIALKWYTKAYLEGYDCIGPKLYDLYKDVPYEQFFIKRLFRNLSIASCAYFRLNDNYIKKEYFDLNNRLGVLCALGYGTRKDLIMAWSYFTKKYSDRGYSFAVTNLLSLSPDSRDQTYMLKLFEQDQGFMKQLDAEYLYDWGMLFLGGIVQTKKGYNPIDDEKNASRHIIVEKDYLKAFKYLEMAANLNHSEALFQLGMMYHCGYGIDQDTEKGEECFVDAANIDVRLAARTVLLYHTHTTIQNFTLAFEWYKRIEKRMKELEVFFRRGNGNKLLKSGLGLLYEYGDGVEQNYQKAFDCYTKSGDSFFGTHRLGLMHYYGKGVPVDYEKAFYYFNRVNDLHPWEAKSPFVYEPHRLYKSYSQNHLVYAILTLEDVTAESYYYLGLHYRDGLGVSQDEELSLYYLRYAAVMGCKHAKDEIKD
jgi:TPR repeat protein